MNTTKQELKEEFTWLSCFNEPLKETRRQLRQEALAAGYKLHDEKTGD